MKKIIILLGLFFVSGSAFAGYNDCSEFMQSLKLTEKQSKNIDIIEKSYNVKIGALNADILLRKMEAMQLKSNKNAAARINLLNLQIDSTSKKITELNNQKDKEIMSNLGFIQRYKYKYTKS